jgi:hypothetical protein
MSLVRTNSSVRPANTNRSPARSREMNDSSIVPSTVPRKKRTCIMWSLVIVPIAMRCKRSIKGFAGT